jgi:hypothetical protein
VQRRFADAGMSDCPQSQRKPPANECAKGVRDGPRAKMRTARDLKIRVSVPRSNADDAHERDGRCDEGEDGIVAASQYR